MFNITNANNTTKAMDINIKNVIIKATIKSSAHIVLNR